MASFEGEDGVRPNKIFVYVVSVEYRSGSPTQAVGKAADASSSTSAAVEPTKHHNYIVAVWPGHEKHVFGGDCDSFGNISNEALWPAFRAATSVAAAADLLLRHNPELYYMRATELLKNKALQLAMARAKSTEKRYALADFTIPSLGKLLRKRSILLSGNAGIGKTCYAEAHSPNGCSFVIKTLDQLKDIPGDCDLLIFDDMRFDKDGLDLTPEEMICLLDVKREGSIKCRHYDGRVPCIPRIFTTNLDPFNGETIFPTGKTRQQEKAIRRRMVRMNFLEQQLFVRGKGDEGDEEDESDEELPW